MNTRMVVGMCSDFSQVIQSVNKQAKTNVPRLTMEFCLKEKQQKLKISVVRMI